MNKLKRKSKTLALKSKFGRLSAFSAAVLLIVGLAIPTIVPNHKTHAAELLTARSLDLSSSANGDITTNNAGVAVPAGEGGNGQKTKHTVKFTMATSGATIGSILIMYCTNPVFQSTCTTPTGFTATNLTNASLTVTGLNASAFTLDTTTINGTQGTSGINTALTNLGLCNGSGSTRVNCVAMQRSSGVAETLTPTATIAYGGTNTSYITNPLRTNCSPNNDNCSFYARVMVFSDTAYTTLVDYGGLAASTTQQVDITAKVQEILNFSVGTTVTSPVNNATCTPFNDTGALTLGDANNVLSTTQAYDNHSYFRINTNTVGGTKVFYSGDTLKSGSNIITAIGTSSAASAPGTKQFGLAVDQDDTQSGSGYSFTDLTKTAPYATGHGTIVNAGTAQFAFDTASKTVPVEVASSPGGITCDTGSIRYIANISTATVAGIYRTTITYIATGTY